MQTAIDGCANVEALITLYAYTEQEVIPFDTSFTKLSADRDGMYFKLNMKGLQPERYYRVLFKHTNKEGTIVYDNDYYFKVVR